jgi:hypothetical protein
VATVSGANPPTTTMIPSASTAAATSVRAVGAGASRCHANGPASLAGGVVETVGLAHALRAIPTEQPITRSRT